MTTPLNNNLPVFGWNQVENSINRKHQQRSWLDNLPGRGETDLNRSSVREKMSTLIVLQFKSLAMTGNRVSPDTFMKSIMQGIESSPYLKNKTSNNLNYFRYDVLAKITLWERCNQHLYPVNIKPEGEKCGSLPSPRPEELNEGKTDPSPEVEFNDDYFFVLWRKEHFTNTPAPSNVRFPQEGKR